MTKHTKLRPFTRRTVEVCEIIEFSGPIDVTKLVALTIGTSSGTLSKICCLATMNKLLTGSMKVHSPGIYEVTPNWRSIVAARGISNKESRQIAKPITGRKLPIIPITEAMVEICEVLESTGASICQNIADQLYGVTAEQVSKTCAYGFRQGVVVIGGEDWRSRIYAVSKNWRQIVKDREIGYKLPEPAPTQWTGVSSIFHFAERCCNSVTAI